MTDASPDARPVAGTAPVVVALATFRRPEMLARCLASLAEQTIAAEDWDRTVIVVDNDPAGSGRDRAHEVAAASGLVLVYEVEPEPGIAAARNRCVALAESRTWLAFLDDDEWAEPDWLARLVATARDLSADMTGGPVRAVLPVDAPAWATRSSIYERTDPEADAKQLLATNNLLVRLAMQDQLGPLFDNAYGLTGGSDRLLSLRAARAGFRLGWAPAAVVNEVVPPERLTIRWVVRRGYRLGTVAARMDLELGRLPSRRAAALTGARTALRSSITLVAGVVRRDPDRAVRAMRTVAKGVGVVAGARGVRYDEYGRG